MKAELIYKITKKIFSAEDRIKELEQEKRGAEERELSALILELHKDISYYSGIILGLKLSKDIILRQ